MLLRPAPPGSRRQCLRWSRWTCGCCASAQGRAVDDCRRGPAVASARSEPRQHHPHPPPPPSAPPGSLTGHHFMNLNTIFVKVFVLLHSSQVMETSQSAVAKHDGTEEDGEKRLREILFCFFCFFCFILGELYLCMTLPAVLSPFRKRGTFRTGGAACLFVSICRACVCAATRPANGNELGVIAEVAAPITVYLTAVLSQLTPSGGR